MEQAIQQRPAVVAEGGRGVGVDLKLVPGSISLELQRALIRLEFVLEKGKHSKCAETEKITELDRNRKEIRKYYLQVLYWFRKLLNFIPSD